MVPNAELDELKLNDLADRLANVRSTRTNQGFGMENAVQKSSLERRIMQKVMRHETSDDSKLLIDYPIVFSVEGNKLEADGAEIRAGGLFIPGEANFATGTIGTLEVKTENDYRLRVKCVVREHMVPEPGVCVAFAGLEGSNERRVNRFILELLKNQAS